VIQEKECKREKARALARSRIVIAAQALDKKETSSVSFVDEKSKVLRVVQCPSSGLEKVPIHIVSSNNKKDDYKDIL